MTLMFDKYIDATFDRTEIEKGFTNKDAIDELMDYKETLQYKFDKESFQDDLELYCMDKLICPKCGSDDLNIGYTTENSEAWGMPVTENLSDNIKCNDCGFTIDLDKI